MGGLRKLKERPLLTRPTATKKKTNIILVCGIDPRIHLYRATDSKLNRQIAIKVLPAYIADDAEWLARRRRIHGIVEADPGDGGDFSADEGTR
jgi:hypothetical protein